MASYPQLDASITLPPPPPPLPVGYRFIPRDHELLNHYLYPKITRTFAASPYPKLTDFDIYVEHPSKIFRQYSTEGEDEDEDDEQRYFFTLLKKTTKKGARINRKVPNYGTWKEENKKDILMPKTKKVLGSKKYFKFVENKQGKESQDKEVDWLMHEYSLKDTQEMVICRITKKINTVAVADNKKRRATKQLATVEDKEGDNVVVKRRHLEEDQSINYTNVLISDVDNNYKVQQGSSSTRVYEDLPIKEDDVIMLPISRVYGNENDLLIVTDENLGQQKSTLTRVYENIVQNPSSRVYENKRDTSNDVTYEECFSLEELSHIFLGDEDHHYDHELINPFLDMCQQELDEWTNELYYLRSA